MSKAPLSWYVFREDNNLIKPFDVFTHYGFSTKVEKAIGESKTKEELSNKVKDAAMYHFWAKCEYEIILSPWPPHITYREFCEMQEEADKQRMKYGREPVCLSGAPEHSKKIDIYEQLMLNWDKFIDYIYDWSLLI